MNGCDKNACCCRRSRLLATWLVVVFLVQQPSIVWPRQSASGESLEQDLEDFLSKLQQRNSRTCGQLNDAAERWINSVDSDLGLLIAALSTANWNYITNLTEDNSAKLAKVQDAFDEFGAEQLLIAKTFLQNSQQICNGTVERLIRLFANSFLPPVASNPQTRSRINQLVNGMTEVFSTASIADGTGKLYRMDPELTALMATSRDYDQLLWAWQGWRNVTGRLIKADYLELVDKMNEAAKDNGHTDVGAAWQMTDFGETDMEQIMDLLYEQIKPFYEQIHAFVRRRLVALYPNKGIDPKGPIPAHLLGDMWAQEWLNIGDAVLPYPSVAGPDVTAALMAANFSVAGMFHTAEQFFTSLGLEPMTNDFWNRSVLVRPTDNRPIVCHGSAEDFMSQTDFRIKMCTEVNAVDFSTVHHEMGHIEYFMQYRHRPTLFRSGANAAFHEAVGDTIALSVLTPQHLHAIGLVSYRSRTQAYEREINFLMKMALSKVVFLPYAYIVDKWRYAAFRGDIKPAEYNAQWWKFRERYQGVKAPVPRSNEDFDPGAKYHVPANVPYSRYFLSFIGQFQFQSALCKVKGHTGPLHTCDIYQSHEAGTRLKSMLSLGASKPWREAMRLMTGQTEFRADAILDYFQPLIDWLAVENNGLHVGW